MVSDHAGAPLTGRQTELEALAAALAAVRAGGARALVVSGEPGIGKTALLDVLAGDAAAAGLRVLRGRASEQEREVPYSLVVDALDDAAADAGASAPELGAVLPSLAGGGGGEVSSLQRFRLHRALRRLVEELGAETPVLLVLDDLHWADDASLEWVLHMLRRPAGMPHILALGVRAVDPLAQLLDAARSAVSAHLQLGPLDDGAAVALLQDVPPPERRRLLADARGNPLFLESLARLRKAGDAMLPSDLMAVVAREVAALPPAARALLEGAAVAGDPFDVELAAAAAGLDEDVHVALDAVVAADLVRPAEGGFAFRHPLVRRAVHEAAPAGWRVTAHARAGRALAARGAGPVAVAHHVERSAAVGDAEAAATLVAAARAVAGRAPATAARWFRAALRLRPDLAGEQLVVLLAGLGEALAGAGRHAEARGVLLELLELTRSAPAGDRAELVASTAAIEHLLGRHEEAVARVRSAIAELDETESALRARLTYELATGALFEQDHPELSQLAGRSADALRGDEPALAAADEALAVIAAQWGGRPDDVPPLLARMRASVAALTPAAVAARPEVAFMAGYAELFTEHLRESVRTAEWGLVAIREGGRDRMLVLLAAMHAMAANAAGDHAAAVESGLVAEEASRLANDDYGLQWSLWVRVMAASDRGERAEAAALIEECERVMDRIGDRLVTRVGRCNLAAALLDEDPERCTRTIAANAGPEFERVDRTWGSRLMRVQVEALLVTGRREEAVRVAGLLTAWAAEMRLPMAAARRDHAHGLIALADGDAERAAELARAALAGADERGYAGDAFAAELLLGRALARAGDRDAAVEVLRGAARRAAAGGAWGLRDTAASELRRLGARPDAATQAAAERPLLTARERRVAELVAAGRGNKQVAATLHVSRKTVEHTLTRVYAKLGVRSRMELAAALRGGDG